MLESFVTSGAAALLAIAVLVLESTWLLWQRCRGRGLPWIDHLLLTLPGLMLMLALYGAQSGAPWIWPALALAAALPCHLLDLHRRARTRVERLRDST